MSGRLRVMVSAGFGEGHAYPALALSRALRGRGHEVLVELSERWREQVLEIGGRFTAATDYIAFPGAVPPDPSWPTVLETARGLAPVIADFAPDVVVSDLVAPAPALAAELARAPHASLVPLVFPVQGPGLPPFEQGLIAPRTRLGAAGWRLLEPALRPRRQSTRWLSRVPELVAETRAELGLPPRIPWPEGVTTYGPLSAGLVLVATFPQLEYPRRWPPHVHVTGPLAFELPHPEVPLPPGEEPLIVVAASTVHAGRRLIAGVLEGLADEPVRVIATLNRRGEAWEGPVPERARVVDWLSYSQVIPRASLVIGSGGHGTVARALAEDVPLLISPVGAETAENGARVSWSGAGLMLPGRLTGPRSLRLAVRRLLAERRFARRAAEIGRWARGHDPAVRAAELIEAYARR